MCVGSHVGQSRTTLGDPVESGPPGPSVHGIFQAKILEWLVIYYSGDLPNLGIKPESPASPELAGGCFLFFNIEPPARPPDTLLQSIE